MSSFCNNLKDTDFSTDNYLKGDTGAPGKDGKSVSKLQFTNDGNNNITASSSLDDGTPLAQSKFTISTVPGKDGLSPVSANASASYDSDSDNTISHIKVNTVYNDESNISYQYDILAKNGAKGDIPSSISLIDNGDSYAEQRVYPDGAKLISNSIAKLAGEAGYILSVNNTSNPPSGDYYTTVNELTLNQANNKTAKAIISTYAQRGLQGLQGEQGIQGVQGKQGIQGDKGDKGDKGESASLFLNSNTNITGAEFTIIGYTYTNISANTHALMPDGISIAPKSSITLTDEDSSIESSNNQLVLLIQSAKTAGLQYPSLVVINPGQRGPQGDRGPQGVQGIQGIQGKQGAQVSKIATNVTPYDDGLGHTLNSVKQTSILTDGSQLVTDYTLQASNGKDGKDGASGLVNANAPLSYDKSNQSISIDTSGMMKPDGSNAALSSSTARLHVAVSNKGADIQYQDPDVFANNIGLAYKTDIPVIKAPTMRNFFYSDLGVKSVTWNGITFAEHQIINDHYCNISGDISMIIANADNSLHHSGDDCMYGNFTILKTDNTLCYVQTTFLSSNFTFRISAYNL